MAEPHSDHVQEVDEHTMVARATNAARRQWPGAVVDGIRRLEGGVSSLTFACTLRTGDEARKPVVLKVAPPGLEPVRHRDVLRQARVLRALRSLDGFPVPAVLFEDSGAPPLFAMEYRDGRCYEPGLDLGDPPPAADLVAARMRAAARTLARLHNRTPHALGVGDEQVTSVADELTRWQRLLSTVDEDIASGRDELRARLAGLTPCDISPVLVHGDYRLANMLFVDAELEAVIDWEIWSVGDPRSDLAWLLMHTAPAHAFYERRPPRDRAAARGLPAAPVLLEEYAAAQRCHGVDEQSIATVTDQLNWFLALSFYKTAATMAVFIKRDRRRRERDPKLVVAERHLDQVIAAGHAVLDGDGLRLG